MAIVSSVIVLQNVQKDGRIWVLERHTDQLGLVYDRNYLTLATADLNANLAAYAVILGTILTDGEVAKNIVDVETNGSLATPSLKYSTASVNFAKLRAAYANMTQTQAVMTGDYLNTLTDVQLENAFNLTQPQVASLRTNKLQPAATTAAQIRATTGA